MNGSCPHCNCGYPQAFVHQTPKYDNGVPKRRPKKKKSKKNGRVPTQSRA